MEPTSFRRQRNSDLYRLVMAQRSWPALSAVVFYFLSASALSRSLEPVSGSNGHFREPAVQAIGATRQAGVGTCWQRIGEHGRCSGFYLHNVTKAECCAGHHLHIGWTPYTIQTDLAYFEYIVVGKPAAGCQPCKTTCENVNCGANRVCRVIRGRPQCICDPHCSGVPNLHSGPVCGFDGKTYRNQCSLVRYSCRHQQFIPLDYVGACQYSCDDVRCETGMNCVIDQNGLPHCVSCMVDCPNVTDPSERVCGGDGRTYASLCHLERQTCINGRAIRLAYRSHCEAGKTCSEMSCGSDRCLMDERSSTPNCVPCDRSCLPGRGRAAVCGTDNVTHSTYCDMFRTSCSRGIIIETKHYGPCGLQPPSVQTVEPATEQDD